MSASKKNCPIHLLDGGLGTTLVDNYFCVFDSSTPLWSSHLLIADPTTLRAAQKAFGDAGADIILTATYQASFEGFALTDLSITEDVAAKLMRSAVTITADAGKGKGKVALSLGAYGATMVPSQEYSGAYDENHMTVSQLRDWHLRRLGVFLPGKDGVKSVWGQVSFVAFETLPRIEEMLAVREAMGNAQLGDGKKPFWISCVFPGEGNVLPDGSTVREAVKAMLEKREDVEVPMGIGINCTRVGKVESLIEEFEEAVGELVSKGQAEWPALVVYPDGTMGEVYNTSTKVWEKGDTDQQVGSWDEVLFEIVKRTRERGLWEEIFVGGCCKTTPTDVAKLRKQIDALEADP